MTKLQTYQLYIDGKTEYSTKATTPTHALRQLCADADLTLASQDGRYGKLEDGRNAAAMLNHGGRRTLPPLH